MQNSHKTQNFAQTQIFTNRPPNDTQGPAKTKLICLLVCFTAADRKEVPKPAVKA